MFSIIIFLLLSSSIVSISSHQSTLPLPTSTTTPTNYNTLPCPLEFQKFYCLNNANCFIIKIEDTNIYNCECPATFVGQRCEFKNLDESYLRVRYHAMLQQASLTSAFIVIIVLIILFILYLYARMSKERNSNLRHGGDTEYGVRRGESFFRRSQCPATNAQHSDTILLP